ncbi:MAG: hypothetical protein LBR55_06915 [Bacteroidales bacterium]|jgi:Rieske Fe-S protein|nr:hypothetical protein [Bacteroidales bacterium]
MKLYTDNKTLLKIASYFRKPLFRIGGCILLSLVLFFSCKKDKNPVPLTYPNLTIQNIEIDAQYHQLRLMGQSVYIKRSALCLGYNCNGIIIYRYKTDYDYDDFRVFDATCPYDLGNQILTIDKAFPDLAECKKCGSIFSMYGDYMLQGPARYPLRMLRSSFIEGDLHIY